MYSCYYATLHLRFIPTVAAVFRRVVYVLLLYVYCILY